MADWILAIDFGTSFTVTVGAPVGGAPEVVEVRGARRMPSVVFAGEDGEISVGHVAERLATSRPTSVLRAPKSRLGDPSPVVLAGRPRSVQELVAAVLRTCADAAAAQFGSLPSEVRLSYPATWTRSRLTRFDAAARSAGLVDAAFIPEPVAAATAYWTRSDLTPGSFVAVFDLGGGTFDTAVLQVGDAGFELVGRPSGDMSVGGELFDELVVQLIAERLADDDRERIQLAEDPAWQHARAALAVEARNVKETLSAATWAEAAVPLPSGVRVIRVERADVEGVVAPYVGDAVAALERSVADAGLVAGQLAAIQLAGGASHMPLVGAMVGRAFPTVPVERRGDPKVSVAIGAVLAPRARLVAPEAATPTPPPATASVAPPVRTPPPPTAPAWPHPSPSAPSPSAPSPSAPSPPPAADGRPTAFGAPPSEPTSGPLAPSSPRRKRRIARWAAAVAIGAAAVGGAVLLIGRDGNDPTDARRADDADALASIATLRVPAGATAAVLHPTRDEVMTGSTEGLVDVWTRTGRRIRTSDPLGALFSGIGPSGIPVTALAVSPDGSSTVVASEQGYVTITGQAGLDRFQTPWVATVASYSPDGTTILLAGEGSARLVQAGDVGGSPVDLDDIAEGADTVGFSPDSSSVVVVSRDRSVAEVRTTNGALRYEARGDDLVAAEFDQVSGQLVLLDESGDVSRWSTSGARERIDPTSDGATRLSVASTGVAAVGHDDGGVSIVGPSGPVTSVDGDVLGSVLDLQWSPDGTVLVAVHADGTVRLLGAGGERLGEVELTARVDADVPVSFGADSRIVLVRAAADAFAVLAVDP